MAKVVRTRAPWLAALTRQPLPHAAVFLLQMAVVSLLTRKFNSYYASKPGECCCVAPLHR